MSGKKLLIVIPCYNEEEALPSTLKRMETLMNKMLGEKLIDKNSRVMFVDDGQRRQYMADIKKGRRQNSLLRGPAAVTQLRSPERHPGRHV